MLFCAHHRNYLQQLLCHYLNYAAWRPSMDKHQKIRATFILSCRSWRPVVSLSRMLSAQAAGINKVYPNLYLETKILFSSFAGFFFFVNHQNSAYNLLWSNSLWTLRWKLPCVYSLHTIISELDWMTSSFDLHMNTKLLQGSAAVSVSLSYF